MKYPLCLAKLPSVEWRRWTPTTNFILSPGLVSTKAAATTAMVVVRPGKYTTMPIWKKDGCMERLERMICRRLVWLRNHLGAFRPVRYRHDLLRQADGLDGSCFGAHSRTKYARKLSIMQKYRSGPSTSLTVEQIAFHHRWSI